MIFTVGKSKKQMYASGIDAALDAADALEQIDEVLASSRIDGHDEYYQWLMKLEVRYQDLLACLAEEAKLLEKMDLDEKINIVK